MRINTTRFVVPLVIVCAACNLWVSAEEVERFEQLNELIGISTSSMTSDDYKNAELTSLQEYLPELHEQMTSPDWDELSVWDRHNSISRHVLRAWGDSDLELKSQALKSFKASLTKHQRAAISGGIASISDTLLFHFVLGQDFGKTNRSVVDKISGVLKEYYPTRLEPFVECIKGADTKSFASGVEAYVRFLESVRPTTPNVDLRLHITDVELKLTGGLLTAHNQLSEAYSQCLQGAKASPET